MYTRRSIFILIYPFAAILRIERVDASAKAAHGRLLQRLQALLRVEAMMPDKRKALRLRVRIQGINTGDQREIIYELGRDL